MKAQTGNGRVQAADPQAAASLGRELNRAAKATRQYLDRRLIAAGGGYVMWTVLTVLAHEGPLIQRRLAARLAVEGPTLTHQLTRMESSGLVSRTPSITDRRAAQVQLTEQGQQMYQRLAEIVFDGSTHVLRGLNAEEFNSLREHLATIVDNCENVEL